MSHRTRTVSAQIQIAILVVLVVTGSIGLALSVRDARAQADHGSEQRALAIAAAASTSPTIVGALTRAAANPSPTTAGPAAAGAVPNGPVDRAAGQVRARTGASYVVVIDRWGTRWSHPDPLLIGLPITEPVVALDGKGHVGIDHGNLGRSANGRAPVFSPDGRVIGEVSVGVLEKQVSAEVWGRIPSLGAYAAIALLVGALVGVALTRRLKRQTFGLELDELAALLQEREATLHGIHEGVIAVDPDGRISLVNDQAHLLLGTVPGVVGQRVDDRFEGRLADLLSGRVGGADQMVLVGERLVVINRKPVARQGTSLGSVVTLRDRTELEQALRELDDVRSFTDALRAQQHEFSNRMHTLAGLLELGHHDEAVNFASEAAGGTAGMARDLEARIASPLVIALLLAKSTVAAERGVSLEVSGDSRLAVEDSTAPALVSILGNLIDNAIDAAASGPGTGPAAVTVHIVEDRMGAVIEVRDTGPGIPPDLRALAFTDGWSTKPAIPDRRRGLGLALVQQLARRLGGDVEVGDGAGSVLRVTLPALAASTARPGAHRVQR